MEIQLVGRHPQLTDRVREYATKKIAKLERYLPAVTRAKVELSYEDTKSAADRALVQVTLNCNGTLLRAQERSPDFLTAIDAVSDALHRQLGRYKARLYRSEQRRRKPTAVEEPGPVVEEAAEEEPARIVRRKRFPMKPMPPEEAIDEMERLGHDFFLFMNSETGQYNVVYRREGGDYGLIEPEAL